ncbi:down syndrome cell adhesion molecule-like protein Dscam2 [Caerostris darwini]|uniref:Down syndrome cell adhesion molecule-like protein Dscam2 n=1 Tax=Caerostris darwini TaxID=1538125 RepID=A0AAV4N712_9ARAC|nr:down syndrome cell adhesion molecule-like protein Dscam2 [Caerostris darwini]
MNVWKTQISILDDRVLPVNQRQRVFPNGTLLIAGMQPGVDDGMYSCEVSPGQDMTTVSRSFRVIIRRYTMNESELDVRASIISNPRWYLPNIESLHSVDGSYEQSILSNCRSSSPNPRRIFSRMKSLSPANHRNQFLHQSNEKKTLHLDVQEMRLQLKKIFRRIFQPGNRTLLMPQ